MDSEGRLPQAYSEFLKSKGWPLHEIGTSDFAFRREHALQALQLLKDRPIAILGGDVLRVIQNRPEYVYDNWHCDIGESESVNEYFKRTWKTAMDYVKKYPEAEGETNLYLIVLADERWYERHET